MVLLSEVARAVAAVRDADDPLTQARRVAADLNALDADRIDRETLIRLWVQLARAVRADAIPVGSAPGTPQEAEAACRTVLGPARRGRGRPPIPGRERVETMLYPAEVAQVEALIGTEGGNRSDVIAALVRRALAVTEGA